MHQHLALALIIVRQAGGHLLGGHVLHQIQPQGHHGLHSAVKIVHNGAEQRGAGQAAHGGHLRQVLVLQGQAIAAGGAVPLGPVRCLVGGDHALAAAGIPGEAVAGEGEVGGQNALLYQRGHRADEAGGMAAGHGHPV